VNIVDRLRGAPHPEAAPALISGDGVLSRGRLFEQVDAAAADLREAGGVAGAGAVPRVGLLSPSDATHLVLALAVLRAGGCVVPVPPELSPAERDELAKRVGLDVVVVAGRTRWRGAEASRLSRSVGGIDVDLVRFAANGVRAAGGGEPRFSEDDFASLDPAFVRFSSGTTGASKGVVLSHETIARRIAAANGGLGIGADDRVVWFLPMAHHFVSSILLFLQTGAAIVLAPSHLAADVLAIGREQAATITYAAPFHYALLAAEPSAARWPSLRRAFSTTAPLAVETARRFDARLGVPLTQVLGIIEVGLPLMNVERAREKPEAVGRPVPGFEIELRGEPGGGATPGEIGELYVRGPGLLDAYLSPWRRRDEIAPNGWFGTGDLARADGDGDLELVGRRGSVINVAGQKCFPEEIEAALLAHPAVGAARVHGEKHARVGAIPVAEVVPADPALPPTEASLLAHCRARLARFKVPADFRIVSHLATTPSGKVRRS